jgi:hypothetical protein
MSIDARTRARLLNSPDAQQPSSEALMQYQIQTRRPRTRDVVLHELKDASTHRIHAADTLDFEAYSNLVAFIDYLLGELYKMDHSAT